MDLVSIKQPFVKLSTNYPTILSHAIEHVSFELTLVSIAVAESQSSVALSLVVFPVAFVDEVVQPFHLSFSMSQVFVELSFIGADLEQGQTTMTMHISIDPITLVFEAFILVLVHESPFSVPFPSFEGTLVHLEVIVP
jgi:hypothetical protein